MKTMKTRRSATSVMLSSLVVGGSALAGAVLAGFIRGVLVENDPEYYLLLLAALAGAAAVWGLTRLTAGPRAASPGDITR